ncbi:ActS/PrrB/RegB family redox-sensitive histidine kinase [Tropicimonas sp. TH_r6]|uniref:sensor histidine kinase RegB n=1 Tax=Tropicimonas sp. TH_r6 TaxID=3082085 RepID=UPI00295500B0|nr:ActS/PrrB/RegB family redox-sensitive histidine kinase [Tropicimonas sp. TH_r6]MDV7141301.1 ActS/PrrB/RegB family redox-sensitive histidine kinase [Tropicimonas sp. TH_r6]
MAEPSFPVFDGMSRSHWVRLRTLIVLRWVAVSGQLAAIVASIVLYDLQLEIGLCLMAVGVSITANLLASFVYPPNKRLSENETLLTLLFDLSQHAFLLYLSGGLNNPFAFLLLAPVTIAATTLRLRSTALMAGTAVLYISLLGFFYLPLRTSDGLLLNMPDIFRFGFWIAIVVGIGFMALYARRVANEVHSMSDALVATQMALSREQKLTDLGGVVAAAAHELGTPLATIKLVSSEMIEELEDNEMLREDAELVRDQADRCRDILRSMGRAGKDDLHMRQAPLDTVIREAAEPHVERGKEILFDVSPGKDGGARQPSIYRRPEIIHGLRNLVQNAVDFSQETVWVDARWTPEQIIIRIADDGHGFPPQALGRIGDPFMRIRKSAAERAKRPEYEGMGLGLFIAKTLLERSGGTLTFSNGSDPFLTEAERPARSGAIVEVAWSRASIGAEGDESDEGLGENIPFPVG